MLRTELLAQVETPASRALRTQRHEGRPAVVLVVGVNGTGKTTTCGKLAEVSLRHIADQLLGVLVGERFFQILHGHGFISPMDWSIRRPRIRNGSPRLAK